MVNVTQTKRNKQTWHLQNIKRKRLACHGL